MTWRRWTLCACLIGTVLPVLFLRPRQNRLSGDDRDARQQFLPVNTGRVKYPLFSRPEIREETEQFLALREKYYVRPRAYPKREIDPRVRVAAYEQLKKMRLE